MRGRTFEVVVGKSSLLIYLDFWLCGMRSRSVENDDYHHYHCFHIQYWTWSSPLSVESPLPLVRTEEVHDEFERIVHFHGNSGTMRETAGYYDADTAVVVMMKITKL